jgi:predicted MFS family arabinose efflux permease
MLGATIAVGGVGALTGAGLAPWLERRLGLGPAMILSGLLYGLFSALIPLAGGSPAQGMAGLMVAQLLGDAAGAAMFIYVASLRQGTLDVRVLGRVAGAFTAASALAGMLGAVAGGGLEGWIGIRAAMAIACVGMTAAPLFAFASPIRRLRSPP